MKILIVAFGAVCFAAATPAIAIVRRSILVRAARALDAAVSCRVPTILIIEDDYAVCWMVREALQRGGYHVIMADEHSLRDGLLRHISPSLILIDLSLRAQSGIRLGEFQWAKDVPILYISPQSVGAAWADTVAMDTPHWPAHLATKINALLAADPPAYAAPQSVELPTF